MLAIDGELQEPRATLVRDHLSHCWTCKARRAELERSIEDFVRMRDASFNPLLTPGEGPAARLRAQMANVARAERPGNSPLTESLTLPRLAAGALVLSAVAVIAIFRMVTPHEEAGSLPNSRLTPGAVRLISREQVCAVQVDGDNRAIPLRLANQVFDHYGMPTPKPRTYEVDYLISPELGGANDVRNLWPQPYAEGVWNSRVKDALEDHLRRMVCDGRVDLALAQHEIATDWIRAYRKYFRSRQPLAAHALFVKDQPWE